MWQITPKLSNLKMTQIYNSCNFMGWLGSVGAVLPLYSWNQSSWNHLCSCIYLGAYMRLKSPRWPFIFQDLSPCGFLASCLSLSFYSMVATFKEEVFLENIPLLAYAWLKSFGQNRSHCQAQYQCGRELHESVDSRRVCLLKAVNTVVIGCHTWKK